MTAEVPGVPIWSPTVGELDDLELLLHGGYAPLRGFLGAADQAAVVRDGRLSDATLWPVPVGLVVSRAVAESAAVAGALELLDEEGTPVAEVAVSEVWATASGWGVAGPVRVLRAMERGYHLTARWMRRQTDPVPGRAVLGVPVRSPLHACDLAALRACTETLCAHIVLMPLVGQGSPREVDAPGLVRACRAAAGLLRAQGCEVDIVPIPVPRHCGSTDDREALLAALVAGAYGASHVPGPLPPYEGLPTVVELPAVAQGLCTGSWEHVDAVPNRTSHCGVSVLFTGLSGSGKSTLAKAVHTALLHRTDRTVTLLDGDVVRRMLSAELTFTREHRDLNVRRTGFVAAEITRHGGVVLCAQIAPYADVRAEVRAMVEEHGRFVLVHLSTPLAECESRDRKGLYAKARRGEIPRFTGISDPYEEPVDADLVLDTSQVELDDAVELVLAVMSLEKRRSRSWGDRRSAATMARGCEHVDDHLHGSADE
ncbi:MAG: adenylyl-sulfate kinase [Pseudonocardia sp.]